MSSFIGFLYPSVCCVNCVNYANYVLYIDIILLPYANGFSSKHFYLIAANFAIFKIHADTSKVSKT